MSAPLRPRPAVAAMAPYAPPTAGRAGKLRLDFNESTRPVPAAVAAALRAALASELLAIYPEYGTARAAVARHLGQPEERILLTNGTDDAIGLLVDTYVEPGDEVLLLCPSYAMYRFYAERAGAAVRAVDYRAEDLSFPLPELLAALSPRTRLVVVANPNNPTGTALDAAGLARLLAALPAAAPEAALLVDEAYFEFCGVTALPLLPHRQLFVCRTFSKAWGLAGLRLGCLAADPGNATWVRKAQSPYSVNALAAAAVTALLADPGPVEASVREAKAARARLFDGLDRRGFRPWPSAGNFVLFRAGEEARALCEALRQRGILVRDRSHDIPGTVRVTAGTVGQAERFLAALDGISEEGGRWTP
ncbi:MAG: histidinol-phosphate aminotransferase family protein [Thermoanaerobaculia bacterium]|nr:histidinol-phosphate aminotransferase family protein [Thermoanaerobaculia bacterium]